MLAGRGQVALPAIVFVVGILALVGGWLSFESGQPHPIPKIQGGSVSVLTDDPDARIDLHLRLPLDYDLIYEDRPPPLILDIDVKPMRQGLMHWAIVLHEDAAMPYSLEDPSGNAMPRGDRRGAEDAWVQGDVTLAWYFRNARAGWPGEPLERFPNMLGSILAGSSPYAETIELSLVGPSRGPLLIDTGPQQYTNFPVLGAPGEGTAEDGVEFLRLAKGRPVAALVGEGGLERVPADAQALLESTTWFYPTSYTLTDELSDQGPSDRLSQVEPPPAAPLDWTWRDDGRLVVRAAIEQPDWLAMAQRFQFLAGVLAGLAGGLLVWGLELSFGWVTQHRSHVSRTSPADNPPAGP